MNEKNKEPEKYSKEAAGEKFEDLTKEEMEQVQGQGNKDVEEEGAIIDFLTSKGAYTCR